MPKDEIIVAIIILVFILIGIFQWLWNSTMTVVFGLRKISYWQAIKLLMLSSFLFGSSKLLSFSWDF